MIGIVLDLFIDKSACGLYSMNPNKRTDRAQETKDAANEDGAASTYNRIDRVGADIYVSRGSLCMRETSSTMSRDRTYSQHALRGK